MNQDQSDAFLRAFRALRTPQPTPVQSPKIRLVQPKPKVFVSFDYENDAKYKWLLQAWNTNSRFQFTFQDKTPQEIKSDDVGRVKAVLTTKVQEASHTLVLVGRYANQPHLDFEEIGCTNWIQFELQQSMLYKKKLVAVLLEPNNQLPSNILHAQGILVPKFDHDLIMKALAAA